MQFYFDEQGHDGCYLHDPLAIGVAINPGFVTTEAMQIYVETEGKVTAGMTVLHPTRDPAKREAPNVRVCTAVDAEGFLQFFLERVRADLPDGYIGPKSL